MLGVMTPAYWTLAAHKTKRIRRKEGYKKTEILTKTNKFIKYLVAINCINRSEKDIRLFKFPADNIRRQLAVLL